MKRLKHLLWVIPAIVLMTTLGCSMFLDSRIKSASKLEVETEQTAFQPVEYRGKVLGVAIKGRAPIPWAVLSDVFAIGDINYYDGKYESCLMDILMPIVDGDEWGDKPRPALFFVHGGGWRKGSRNELWWTGIALEYAQKGYVTFSVDYRLSGEAPFPAAIEDVKNAVRWARAHAKDLNIDPNQFGAFGHSAGGHLVMCMGAIPDEAGFVGDTPYPNVSSKVHAVVSWAGVSDFLENFRHDRRPGSFLFGPEESYEERARKGSPINYVSEHSAAFLLIPYGPKTRPTSKTLARKKL